MTERYIYTNNTTSITYATDTQLNRIFGAGNWHPLPSPPAHMSYPEWDNTTTQWVDNDRRTWQQKRQSQYMQKTAYEQIEMMADGSFDTWYQGIKNTYPKS